MANNVKYIQVYMWESKQLLNSIHIGEKNASYSICTHTNILLFILFEKGNTIMPVIINSPINWNIFMTTEIRRIRLLHPHVQRYFLKLVFFCFPFGKYHCPHKNARNYVKCCQEHARITGGKIIYSEAYKQ